MKQFEIPEFYRSPIISKVKAFRKAQDPRKRDFTPTVLDFGSIRLVIARHFGFCYGVENAIEIAYRAISENPGKRIFLLSQMIHNPGVNEDLVSHGLRFIQNTHGDQLIPWDEITADDVVIIPAFGTTLEIEKLLSEKGVSVSRYNTTCPFVEKVWNRSEKLGQEDHTIIIHGKHNHEETRATFSHSAATAPSVIVKDMTEAKLLAKCITGELPKEAFYELFSGRYTDGFDPQIHFTKMGVVNQTTMLATETQEIAEYLRSVVAGKYGPENIREHFADTRDTLCYATNDNQSATLGLMDSKPDMAIVVGGYNSSNTTHLVELLETTCPTFFIKDVTEIDLNGGIHSFDIHEKAMVYLPDLATRIQGEKPLTVAVTSGASCPDATVDQVIQRLLELSGATRSVEEALSLATA
jgi:4-hydroxy-3-methylbut-2-en-1-yl diphosphate reductase